MIPVPPVVPHHAFARRTVPSGHVSSGVQSVGNFDEVLVSRSYSTRMIESVTGVHGSGPDTLSNVMLIAPVE